MSVPRIGYVVTTVSRPLWAQFDTKYWSLRLDQARLSAQEMNEVDALSLVAIIYHEVRHAEQAYLIACTLAGQGRKTVEAIQKRYIINKQPTEEATHHPLPKRSARARQASEWLKDITKNHKDPPQARLVQAQANLDHAQVRIDAIGQDPLISEKKRQNAEKRFAEARVLFERAQTRYHAQLIEIDAQVAFNLVVSIWQEEKNR